MNHIKSLASQTAVYGISSILGRLINYLLVPLYTMEVVFSAEQVGSFSYFYAFAAFLLIIYTHGMETTYFRFSEKDKDRDVYSQAFSSVLLVSGIATLVLVLNADSIATLINKEGGGRYVIWMTAIIFLDACTALPFARLRQENKAKKFAILKLGSILINFSLQLFFLLGASGLVSSFPDILGKGPVIDYIFLANLVGNLVIALFLWPYFRKLKLQLNWLFFKPMLYYSIPILLTGLAGTISEQLDKILVRNLMSEADLGIYSQVFKLAVLIQLAVQAFRYAGEPFFFSKAEDKNAPDVFSDVLYYFVIFSVLLFVVISFNIDLIGYIMLRDPIYRIGLYVVPVIMIGKILYGVYINISIWFKIKDKTIYGTYFAIVGSTVTIGGNLLLIPVLGYLGSALTIVLAYLSMVLLCYFIGRKHFPVPYRILPMFLYLFAGAVLVWLSFQYQNPDLLIDSAINIIGSGLIVVFVWLIEKNNLSKKTT